MRSVDLIVTQGIHGFQAGKSAYLERQDGGRDASVSPIRSGIRCPACGQDVAPSTASGSGRSPGCPSGGRVSCRTSPYTGHTARIAQLPWSPQARALQARICFLRRTLSAEG